MAIDTEQLLPLLWASFLGLSITFYVLLDGFSLGVGILFPFAKNKDHRDLMMASVAPVWDGNQTWLVGGGMALLTAFPKGFNLLLSAFYLPLSFMLIALIFRGLAFEFRFKTKKQRFWDIGFPIGSITAAFCQGLILGNYIQGFNLIGSFAAGTEQVTFLSGFLLNPFAIFTGIAVVLAYAMLASCWLVMKNTDEAQAWARTVAARLLPIIGLLVLAVSLLTPLLDSQIADRWFAYPNLIYLSPIPLWAAGSFFLIGWSLRTLNSTDKVVKANRENLPFLACISLYLLVLAGLVVSLFPWIIPRHYNLWDIAAPSESLAFAMIGVLMIVPVIILYTAHAYYVFRGKVSVEDVYH